jgi:RNA polymerase sigma factor for flagellar operon FliA
MMDAVKKSIGVSDDLWKSYAQTKDIETRNYILMEYLYIVKIHAARMYAAYRNFADQDDIISCGSLALLNSIDRFDYTRDIKFETFASIRIRGAMIDYMRKQDWVPRTVRKNIKDIDAAYAELLRELGREPSDEEIAEKLEIEIDDYYDTLSKSYSTNILSIEELIADNVNNSLIPSSDITPESEYETKELEEQMAHAVDSLNEKERTVVSLYYYEGLKAKQIAAILEISESRVSQIHSKALIKLKYVLQKYINLY